MKYEYPCRIDGEEGDYVASFRDVPGALTGGATRAEALELASDALRVALTYHFKKGELPPPSKPQPGEIMVSAIL